jgi:putative FmdB family regulatory protein
MPIYEYECRACHARFEHFIRPSNPPDPALPSCPSCQSTDLERLLSMFAVNSDETQQVHLKQARRAGMKEARDKQHAEVETMRRIEAEHDP